LAEPRPDDRAPSARAEELGNLWPATAVERTRSERLADDVATDVAVIGAGLTGLSAALHLAEAGRDVAVIEAAEPGWGASGRAGGQVLPGLKIDPEEMERRLGATRGRRLADWAGGAAALVFALIERHAIACHPERRGWTQAAYTRRQMSTLENRCRQWAERGADVELLDRPALADMLGTPPELYLGGWIDRRGGSIHPLDFARGLANAAIRHGARVYCRARARALESTGGGWTVTCESGARVSANTVIVATNAYSGDLVPGLRRSLVAVQASQAASEPLDADRLAVILPGRQVASDRRRMLISFRISPDDRLLIGGPGGTGEATGAALVRNADRTAAELFGHVGRFSWAFAWAGCVALTTDTLPHLHEPEPGLHVALGYNGRGLALATAAGRALAERTSGRAADDLALPVTPVRPIRLHRLAPPVVSAGQRVLKVLDQLERRIG
jgi:glycine/D-amino acid oxidase-like deaminating enzyme